MFNKKDMKNAIPIPSGFTEEQAKALQQIITLMKTNDLGITVVHQPMIVPNKKNDLDNKKTS